MRNSHVLLAVLLAFGLMACSSDKKPPLKGERISVLQAQDTLAADATAADEALELAEARANTAWPQAGGNSIHAPQHLALGAKLSKVWSTGIGDGSENRRKLITAPIIAFNSAFTANTEGGVSAFDIRNGKRLWTTNALADDEDPATVSAGLAFAMDTLFVTDGINRLVALDPASGKKRWEKNLGVALRGSPTFNNGRLYVITLNDETLALNPTNGETFWKHQGIAENAGLLGSPSPAAQDSIVMTTYSSGDVVALRAETGQEAWSDNLAGIAEFQSRAVTKLSGFRGHPVIDGDVVIVGNAATRLAAIHIPSGERLWQKEFGAAQTPWVSGNMVFVLTPQNELVALLKETGQIRWSRQLPRFEDPDDKEDPIFWNGPVLGGNHLWIASSDKHLLSIDPTTGKDVNKISIPKNVMLSPVVSNNMLFILTDDGTLLAYRS